MIEIETRRDNSGGKPVATFFDEGDADRAIDSLRFDGTPFRVLIDGEMAAYFRGRTPKAEGWPMPLTHASPLADRLPAKPVRRRKPRRDDYFLALITAVQRGLTSGQVAASLGRKIGTVSADLSVVRTVLRLTGQLKEVRDNG